MKLMIKSKTFERAYMIVLIVLTLQNIGIYYFKKQIHEGLLLALISLFWIFILYLIREERRDN